MTKSIYAFVFALTACSLIDLSAKDAAPEHEPGEPLDQPLFVQRRQIFTNTELLYWKVQENPLDYAIRMKSPAWGPSPAFAKGRYKTTEFDWSPGFRLALGWYNQPRLWEILWQYTWLFTEGSNHGNKPKADNDFIVATWNEMTPSPLKKAESDIHFHYNLADMIISRVFDTNPHLRMRMMAGITTTWMNQLWKVHYSDFNHNEDKIKNHWRFFGTGLRVGVSADWFFSGYFYLIGKATFATLVGSYRNKAHQTTTFNENNPSNNTHIPIRDATYLSPRFAFHNQFLLGTTYSRIFCNWTFEAFAGYEFNIWLNLHEVFRSSQSAPGDPKETHIANGIVGMQGFTLRATFGF